ncbi:hypothetical protein [Streptomyces sp. DH37]|uniref:hypothetical protein n=1 Tax=Streptomyces sp. DH37 TaxID=3040122 RepID=UPI002442AFBC|nr:hypothetical protein [Streptomyces sp. DH37]MDG9703799.1 hypothetical protein [Streptomyces sp. DH37]
MSTITIPADVAELFADTWGDQQLAYDIAGSLTCTEADVLAELLAALGAPDAADIWADAHADEDQPGDAHYREPADSRNP